MASSGITVLWLAAVSGAGIHRELEGGANLAAGAAETPEAGLFPVLGPLSGGLASSNVVLALISILFITAADSATDVLGAFPLERWARPAAQRPRRPGALITVAVDRSLRRERVATAQVPERASGWPRRARRARCWRGSAEGRHRAPHDPGSTDPLERGRVIDPGVPLSGLVPAGRDRRARPLGRDPRRAARRVVDDGGSGSRVRLA